MRWQAVVLAGCAASLAGCGWMKPVLMGQPVSTVRYTAGGFRANSQPVATISAPQHHATAAEPMPTIGADAPGLAAPVRPLVSGPPPWAATSAPSPPPVSHAPDAPMPSVPAPPPVGEPPPVLARPLPEASPLRPLPERGEVVRPLPDRGEPVKPLRE